MWFKSIFICGLSFLATTSFADVKKGEVVFKTYCASCHGPEGAGLVGPNLTDKEVLHGTTKAEVVKVISNGVPAKAMPPWGTILKKDQISDVSDFILSIMGKNLPSPFAAGKSSVTSFPKGSADRPLVMRTYMPKVGLSDEVFANHDKGQDVPKYRHQTGKEHPTKVDKPIHAIPGGIAVNFGEQLSYCFDSTECRLFYVWSGGFMDMTNYWGKGSGGGRKSFGYIGKVLGDVSYLAKGKAALSGKPQFKGYRKIQNVPEFMYSIGKVNFTLKISPSSVPGEAVCEYTSDASNGLTLSFSPEKAAQMTVNKGELKNGVLTLNSSDAASFTITIKPAK
ncbi:MAG: c-type cytochrome [Lentisphaeraceae bacterium]|nr:c-type cytochrome [Lentisphaeraceae bacterium]